MDCRNGKHTGQASCAQAYQRCALAEVQSVLHEVFAVEAVSVLGKAPEIRWIVNFVFQKPAHKLTPHRLPEVTGTPSTALRPEINNPLRMVIDGTLVRLRQQVEYDFAMCKIV